jgi:hypothetical protein
MKVLHVNFNKYNGSKNIPPEKLILPKGEVFAVDVFHDEWCNFYNNTGDCNCRPDVKIRQLTSKNN